MLEHIPEWLGALLRDRRAGHEKLVVAEPGNGRTASRFDLSSPAFADEARMPVRFTADGNGVSPPLSWAGVPAGTASLAMIVEDPDAPVGKPLVHAIVWGMPADRTQILEGEIIADGDGGGAGDVGRNSYLWEGWLPPDPPSGHGEHDYVFQLFALSERPELGRNPGRGAFVAAIAGKVLAVAVLVGTYSRGEAAGVGVVASGVRASNGLATG